MQPRTAIEVTGEWTEEDLPKLSYALLRQAVENLRRVIDEMALEVTADERERNYRRSRERMIDVIEEERRRARP